MRFYADLHIHSKYSRATSRDLDLEHLAHWACRKGISVVATGDFTHPAWRAELKEKLVPAEPGLFRLAPEIEEAVAATLPPACRTFPSFMLAVEISTIYKKGERTRKIHHLIYAPDFATADRISARLAEIGNIASDGRPILGLDSRNLLEITLDASPDAYLVPAHIWTPWFAALGSQSGFDSITECYGDLADHIFAVETGLSSDPAMNWRVSFLDRYRLTSNSDAHSPGKLGREATTFNCAPDYFAIRRALETGEGYVGTVEFFPEEGKYHLDGHRKCGVRLEPKETLSLDGRCPVCGERVTVGVLHRVEKLADRSEAEVTPPPTAGEVANLVALPEVLSEIVQTGPSSRRVAQRYDKLVAALGPELSILSALPIEDIARADTLLGEAVTRLRAGKVTCEAGYDGEYGVIRLFDADEIKGFSSGGLLFDAPALKKVKPKTKPRAAKTDAKASADTPAPSAPGLSEAPQAEIASADAILALLDPDQRAAAQVAEGPLVILAGPGSGKTRTLTHRIAHLIADHGVPPTSCLAVTFTRRAAAEMRERLTQLLPEGGDQVPVHTFHSLGLALLREHAGDRAFHIAGEAERTTALAETLGVSERKARGLLGRISKAKRSGGASGEEIADAFAAYAALLEARGWVDFDDLVGLAAEALAKDQAFAARIRERFRFLSVDEFQDVDEQQYGLLTLLAPSGGNICVIGDPDQAIYGFRGADASCFHRFRQDHPNAVEVRLKRNYRSTGTIVAASAQVITAARQEQPLAQLVRDMQERITIHAAPTDKAEAEFIVSSIEDLVGGHTFFSIDSGRSEGQRSGLSFSDIAVLYRTEAQSPALVEALVRSGIPFKKHSHGKLTDDPAVRALLDALPADADLRAGLEQAARSAHDGKDGEKVALQRLTKLGQSCGFDRGRFDAAMALATEADFWDPRAERVSLLTLHAAKGLEFAAVFIVGLEDGLLPLYWGRPDAATLEEERRLFYVGMTRARDRLILSRALKRPWRGTVRTPEPSSFLRDIEAELLRQQHMPAMRRQAEDRQLKLL